MERQEDKGWRGAERRKLVRSDIMYNNYKAIRAALRADRA